MHVPKIDKAIRSALDNIASIAMEGGASHVLEHTALLGDVAAFYRKHWGISLDWIYEQLLNCVYTQADIMSVAAIDADSRFLPTAAVRLAEMATKFSKEDRYAVALAGFLRKSGDLEQARKICTDLAQQQPINQQIITEQLMGKVAGLFWKQDYYQLLGDIHMHLKPRVYLEVGVATGKSLALVQRDTIALGVDPVSAELERLLYHSPVNRPSLYKQTSDDFFATQELQNEMKSMCFDLAFIDGLHHFDQVLRDFINIEKFAGPESVVLIHDCLPVDPQVATREQTTAFWTGDVWRIIPCLKAIRPDLEIITLPLAPAGLAVVRRLDASSKVLANHYDYIVSQFEQIELPELWDERSHFLAVEQDELSFSLEKIMPIGGWSC